MNKFNQTTPPIIQPQQPTYSDRQFLHTFLAGALLPLVQATITAVMAFIGTLTLLYLFDVVDLLKPALITASIVWVLTWLYLQRRWLTLTSFERMTGIDIDGDGQIGKPVKEPEVVRIQIDEVTADGHIRQNRFANLPISNDKLTVIARGLLGGRSFSEREWSGAGKILSSNEFRTLRTEMIKRGLLEVANDKDQRQGYVLTRTGRAVMTKFSQIPAPARQEEVKPLSDEEWEAIEKENADYAEKFGS